MLITYKMIRDALTEYKAADIKIKRMSDTGEEKEVLKL